MRLGWRKKRRRSRPASAAIGPDHDASPLPVSLANTSASVGRLVAMAASRPGGNSSAMRGTSSWPRGASTTTSPSTTRPASASRAVMVGAQLVGALAAHAHDVAGDVGAQLVGRAGGGHAAAVEDRDAVAALGLLGLVRGHDDAGAARRRQRRDLVPDPAQRLGIDAAPGLVEQQQRRLVQQHARDLDAPAHAARIRRRRLVGAVAERHQRQRLVDAAGRQRARHAVERGAERAGSRARSA